MVSETNDLLLGGRLTYITTLYYIPKYNPRKIKEIWQNKIPRENDIIYKIQQALSQHYAKAQINNI